MENNDAEYVVRDFSAVDRQVEEMSKREKALTWRLKIENLKRLGIPLILFSCALSILILAVGFFIFLVQQERVVEIDKIVELTREIPIISEKIKVVEVPIYIESPKIKIDETTTDIQANSSPKLGNLGLEAIEQVAGSDECVNSLSYDSKCVDTWKYPNGAIYDGVWYKGKAHGPGTITFEDGGSISGTWLNGELQKVQTETKSLLTPLKSVTYFGTVSGSKVNSLFDDITVGHNFASGADTSWADAYCYLRIVRSNGETLRVDLSRHSSFVSKITKQSYKYSTEFTKKQFIEAQNKCPYTWTGFN